MQFRVFGNSFLLHFKSGMVDFAQSTKKRSSLSNGCPQESPRCGPGARLMGSLVPGQPDTVTSSPLPSRPEELLTAETPPVMCVSGPL
jgi:hypothetical protein